MKRMILAAMALGLMQTSAQAGALDKESISSDASWVLHVDIDKWRDTTVGDFILGQMKEGKADEKMSAIQAMFQFDPRTDLSSFTVYGRDNDEKKSVGIVDGRFDRTHLVTLMKGDDVYKTMSHGDVTIHQTSKDGKNAAAGAVNYSAFVGNNRIMVSENLDALKNGLDVLSGKSGSLANATDIEWLAEADGTHLFVGASDIAGMGGKAGQGASSALAQQARSGFMSLSEVDNQLEGRMVMATDSPEAAAPMTDILRGMLAMAMLNAEEKPELALLAQGTRIGVEDELIVITMRFPSDRVVEMMKEAQARKMLGNDPAAE